MSPTFFFFLGISLAIQGLLQEFIILLHLKDLVGLCMYICSDNQERARVSELTFKMCKSLIKHMSIICQSHVYNIVFEVNGVGKV